MGSFDVACGVSRITIHPRNKAVLVPLMTISDDEDSRNFSGGNIVSNYGPKHTYIPFALPIVGKYDDYGRMGNIVRDKNVEVIEKYFGCTIEQFVETILSGKVVAGENFPTGTIASMWVHGDVYKQFTDFKEEESNNKQTAYNQGYLYHCLLTHIGFVEGNTTVIDPLDKTKTSNQKRYTRPFTHASIPGFVLYSDGTWATAFINDTEIKYGLHSAHCLKQCLLRNNLFVPDQMESLKELHPSFFLYKSELDERTRRLDFAKKMHDRFMELGNPDSARDALRAFSLPLSGECMFSFSNQFGIGKNYLSEIYGDFFIDNEIRDLILDFKTFENSLWQINADYRPSWNGCQHGDDRAMLRLGNLIVKISKENIKRRSE